MSFSELKLREAKLEDFQEILDITKGEYLWNGLDYIPFALKNWLQEGSSDKCKRNNIVFEKNDEIVGFESFYFLDNGKTVIRFGFRVKKDLRGKGFGRRMLELQMEYLRTNFPKVTHTLSTMPDTDMADSAFTTEKFGEKLSRRAVLFIVVNLREYKIPTVEVDKKLVKLSKDKYQAILQNGRLNQLIPGCVHMSWVSATIHSQDDIKFVTRKQATVFVDDSENPNSFSILSHAIPVPLGRRCGIDMYANTKEDVNLQLNHQLREVLDIEVSKTGFVTDNMCIQICIPPEQLPWVDDSLVLFGLKDKIVNFENNMNRDIIHMYVYKDKLFK